MYRHLAANQMIIFFLKIVQLKQFHLCWTWMREPTRVHPTVSY